jgi:hypothetical protein
MSPARRRPRLSFSAFLSHRYKSPAVNLYFFGVFEEEDSEVQFEVDIGTKSLNVTRLERMIRNADAFIGIYPYPGDAAERAQPEQLRDASRYFRLECDLAVRSGRPALVFFDQRYSQFTLPPSVRAEPFDPQEVSGHGGSPNRPRFRRVFREFCDEVRAEMARMACGAAGRARSEVGLLVPRTGPAGLAYDDGDVACIRRALERHGFDDRRVRQLPWPPRLDLGYLSDLECLDWLVADVGTSSAETGIVGYLHGRLVPTVRLAKGAAGLADLETQRGYQALCGGVEVGYAEDVLPWAERDVLERQLTSRLAVLTEPARRIASAEQAREYFSQAALRQEAVFLSYSGRDVAAGGAIAAELKTRFQQVFDYRDGASITPGQPWLQEVFDRLALAGLGIPLLSEGYLASGNCLHEAREMVARADARQMVVVPVVVRREQVVLPSWLGSLQFLDAHERPAAETVDRVIESFDRARAAMARP